MYGYSFNFNHGVLSSGGGGGANPLWNGLQAYYTADNTPNDATSNGYNGTLTNGATYGTGKINQGFSFDGVNDYVELPRQMFEVINDFSVSFWIKGNGTSTISIFGNQFDTSGFRVDYLSNNKIFFRYFVSGGGSVDLTSIGTVARGDWAFITVTKDSVNGGKIYINGVLDNSDTITTDVNYFNPNFAYPVVGTVQTAAFTRYFYFDGLIDEVGLFNTVKTASEVTELYNSGSGKQYT